MVYQPHRYSRTLELFDQFIDVLSQVDQLILLETYAAGEAPIEGALGIDLHNELCMKASTKVHFAESIAEVPLILEGIIDSGDLVITQGAGETAQLAHSLTERWHALRIEA